MVDACYLVRQMPIEIFRWASILSYRQRFDALSVDEDTVLGERPRWKVGQGKLVGPRGLNGDETASVQTVGRYSWLAMSLEYVILALGISYASHEISRYTEYTCRGPFPLKERGLSRGLGFSYGGKRGSLVDHKPRLQAKGKGQSCTDLLRVRSAR